MLTLYQISVHGKTGQANINNNSITNNFLEKEQGYYHQGYAPDDKKPVPLLSLEQAKEIIRYDDLRCEALAWGELKAKLGYFSVRCLFIAKQQGSQLSVRHL